MPNFISISIAFCRSHPGDVCPMNSLPFYTLPSCRVLSTHVHVCECECESECGSECFLACIKFLKYLFFAYVTYRTFKAVKFLRAPAEIFMI